MHHVLTISIEPSSGQQLATVRRSMTPTISIDNTEGRLTDMGYDATGSLLVLAWCGRR